MTDNQWIAEETQNLISMWQRHDAGALGNYLVSDVEDPRLNIQSILTRRFLVQNLFSSEFLPVLDSEIEFGLVMNWLIHLSRETIGPEEIKAIIHALEHQADDAEGLFIPQYLSSIFASLPRDVNGFEIPNYFKLTLERAVHSLQPQLPDPDVLNTFRPIWKQALDGKKTDPISVLEPACGSANDFRFISSYGLAEFIQYRGFDLSEHNVGNACKLFPKADFFIGNVLEIQQADQSSDYVIVHDLFEHLSERGIEQAISEVCRVAGKGLCIGFFNMDEMDEHEIVPMDKYHWNKLSTDKMRNLIEDRGFETQVFHISTLLRNRFGCEQTHNLNAYTFWAWRNVTNIESNAVKLESAEL